LAKHTFNFKPSSRY